MKARCIKTIVAMAFVIAASAHESACFADPAAVPTSASAASDTGVIHLPDSLPLIRETDAQHGGGGAHWTALLVLAALACAGTIFVRRNRRQVAVRGGVAFGWTSTGTGKPARIVQSLRLTPKASAHVVQWRGREWLIACTDGALTVLGQEPGVPEATPPGAGAEAV